MKLGCVAVYNPCKDSHYPCVFRLIKLGSFPRSITPCLQNWVADVSYICHLADALIQSDLPSDFLPCFLHCRVRKPWNEVKLVTGNCIQTYLKSIYDMKGQAEEKHILYMYISTVLAVNLNNVFM